MTEQTAAPRGGPVFKARITLQSVDGVPGKLSIELEPGAEFNAAGLGQALGAVLLACYREEMATEHALRILTRVLQAAGVFVIEELQRPTATEVH